MGDGPVDIEGDAQKRRTRDRSRRVHAGAESRASRCAGSAAGTCTRRLDLAEIRTMLGWRCANCKDKVMARSLPFKGLRKRTLDPDELRTEKHPIRQQTIRRHKMTANKRMPEDPLLPRLLKKVHMQAERRVPIREDGCRREATRQVLAAPREREGYPSAGWVHAGGPFSAACLFCARD